MYQRGNHHHRKKLSIGPFVVILLLLAFVFALAFIFSPKEESPVIPLSPQAVVPAAEGIEITAPPSPEPLPVSGTLLESGINLNEGYYKKFDFTGALSDLTSGSFALGKEHPATNAKTGQDHHGCLTIHYGANTMIKTAKLYYPEDRYEIFMGSAADLETSTGGLVEVVLENSDAQELWAKEIVVSEFIFD